MASSKEIEEVLSRLESAPQRFAVALSRFEDADSVMQSEGGEWSPLEVLAHVRASNDIMEPRLFQVLVRDNPVLPAYDDAAWARVGRYASLPITALLQTMRLRRKELVHALRGLPQPLWERTGAHEERGRMTLFELALYVANHDAEHIAQIEREVRA